MGERTAAVVTVSDGVAGGRREDRSGPAVAARLREAGFDVARSDVVSDDAGAIVDLLTRLARNVRLVATTGGTGLGPRDVTPEATREVIDREVPGLAEAMRAAGRSSTPAADLSRGLVGARGTTLILNLPGSERGAIESIDAVLEALPHALDLLEGDTEHGAGAEVARPGRDVAVVATAIRTVGDPPCRPGQKLVVRAGVPLEGTLGCAEFDTAAIRDAGDVAESNEPRVATYEHDLGSIEVYLEPQPSRPGLVVLGATPVAASLLRWGRELGFDPVLVEPRAERVTPQHRRIADSVFEKVGDVAVDERTAAVHTDHDAPLLAEHVAELIRRGASFVGVMGSRRHAAPHLESLRAMGLSEEELARVRTPVGLDIGARSPEEIALSILAGIVAARNGRNGAWLDGSARP